MDDNKYQRAKKRVKVKQEFYRHLGSYLVMSIFFFLLNAVTSFGNWWFYWPMLGWGLAVLFHYVDVFGIPGIEPMTPEWEEQQIREEMKRIEKEDKRMNSRDDELDLKPLRDSERMLREKTKMERPEQKRWDDSELV